MSRVPHPGPASAASAAVRAARERPGWIVAAAGAVLCVLGWYGVSGESAIERQVPYLASATAPGAALIVAGAVLVAGRPGRRGEQADERVEQLYGLLMADDDESTATAMAAVAAPSDAGDRAVRLVAVPEGTLYHRDTCPMVAGKSEAEVVDAGTMRRRALKPCPVCDPPEPTDAADSVEPTDPAS